MEHGARIRHLLLHRHVLCMYGPGMYPMCGCNGVMLVMGYEIMRYNHVLRLMESYIY